MDLQKELVGQLGVHLDQLGDVVGGDGRLGNGVLHALEVLVQKLGFLVVLDLLVEVVDIHSVVWGGCLHDGALKHFDQISGQSFL